jgi:tetratricopeptide (TPR) repeat protein
MIYKVSTFLIAYTVLFVGLSTAQAGPAAMTSRQIISSSYSNLNKAQKIFELLLTKTPHDPDLYRYLGDIHAGKGNIKQAVKYYEGYIKRRANDYYGYMQLGELARSRGKHEAAKQHFNEALKVVSQKKDLRSKLDYARLLALTGDQAASEEQYLILLYKQKYEPNKIDVINSYVDTLLDIKDYKTARSILKSSSQEYPDNYTLLRRQVRIDLSTYQYARAQKNLKYLTKTYPDDEHIKLDYASLLYVKERWKKAKRLLKELKKNQPENRYIQDILDDLMERYQPQVTLGWDYTRLSAENLFGPYVIYQHPLNSDFTFISAYHLNRYTDNIPNYNSDYRAWGNRVETTLEYKPLWFLTISGTLRHQMVDSEYEPAILGHVEYFHPYHGRGRLESSYNEEVDDPVQALYFDTRKKKIGALYEKRFFDRLTVVPSYTSQWYKIDASRTVTVQGNPIGREDVVEMLLSFDIIKKPRIYSEYSFHYSNFHFENNSEGLIPFVDESLSHHMGAGIVLEWGKLASCDIGGYLGHDSKRRLSLGDLDAYGFHIDPKIKINKKTTLKGHYEYSSESQLGETGRYQAAFLELTYRF